MTPKEIMAVVGGAIVVTNVAIIATLFGAGFFDSDSVPEEPPPAETPVETAAPLPPEPDTPPPLQQGQSIAAAIYICEEKIKSSNNGKRFSYQYDSVASYFEDESRTYKLFFLTQTASRESAPSEIADVTCEVSVDGMKINNYKALKQ